LLFNLEEDDVVLQEFERIKGDFLEVKKELKEMQDTFDERLKFDYQNDETGELEKKYIRDEIDKLNKEVNNNIVEFNEHLKKKGLSGDIMSFYITDILEKQNQIRQLRYYNGFKIIETKTTPKKEIKYSIYSKEISYKNQEIVKEKGKIIEYMRPKVEETSDNEFDVMEREIPGKLDTTEDDDSDVEWSPTAEGDGSVKVPKHLTIKIPTETAQTSNEPPSPEYIPGITNQEPKSPDYSPTSPTYSPTSPTFGPNDPNPYSDTIPELQEVNLSDLKAEK